MVQLFFVFLYFLFSSLSFATPTLLRAVEEPIIVHGKSSQVFKIIQPDQGYMGIKGEWFDAVVKNETSVPISIHWHGLILPNDQDGVPYVTQLPIEPKQEHHYRFKIKQAGTFWMHSHFKFHEQLLMAAPLILKDKNDSYKNDKDVTILLEGFSFTKPETIFYQLQHPKMTMSHAMQPDLNDVTFDAYLANRKTLSQPEWIFVKPNEKVRLRIINGATASNFWIKTGALQGKLIAVDGNNITPILNTRFQLAVAQRADIEVTIPKTGGVFPILAQVEGLKNQTGIILATKRTKTTFSELANEVAPALDDQQEFETHALEPLAKKAIDATLHYELTGDMQHYIWKINNEIWPKINPLTIKQGNRVELVFKNETGMAHPMHFHGHVFQVTEINGKKLSNGPMRDTILVLPHSTKKVIFDADNPGIWMLHCHVLYHMAAGMMSTLNYIGYPEPEFYKKLIGQKYE